jgi:hypothetical protein
MVEGYIVETMPFNKTEEYKRYLVTNDNGVLDTWLIEPDPTLDRPKHVRKMTKTFEIVVDDTKDVGD